MSGRTVLVTVAEIELKVRMIISWHVDLGTPTPFAIFRMETPLWRNATIAALFSLGTSTI